jgi:hypothetical protein
VRDGRNVEITHDLVHLIGCKHLVSDLLYAGQSNSSYSLANQLRLNPHLFGEDNAVCENNYWAAISTVPCV